VGLSPSKTLTVFPLLSVAESEKEESLKQTIDKLVMLFPAKVSVPEPVVVPDVVPEVVPEVVPDEVLLVVPAVVPEVVPLVEPEVEAGCPLSSSPQEAVAKARAANRVNTVSNRTFIEMELETKGK